MSAETNASDLVNGLIKKGLKQKDIAREVGVSQGTVSKWRSGQHDPEASEYRRLETLHAARTGLNSDSASDRAVAQIGGRRVSRNLSANAMPEIDPFAGTGGGGYPLPAQVERDGRTYSANVVTDEWIMPARFLRDELRVHLPNLDVLRIRGNSMETTEYAGFREGDRVVVDRADKRIRQGAIFAIRDGDETIIKQVEIVRGTDPPRITCTSLNKNYQPFELVLDESADIIGRVVLKISRT